MRKFKYLIGILLLFLIVGFTTISVTLSISGNANVISNLDDFKVYFSNALINNNSAKRLIKNDKELVFDIDLKELGETYTISYDVTNASSLLDAALSINCTQSNEYLTITNEFDTSTLPALTTRTGNLTITKKKTSASETTDSYPITCNIVASPIERTTTGTGSVVGPVAPAQLAIGDVISIHGENFNVISVNNNTVSIFATKGLDTNYKQSDSAVGVSFSNTNGWVNTPGPKEIDIQAFDGPVKTYVNEYTNYIKELTKEDNITGDLITVKQLKSLGCTIQATNYTFSDGDTCTDSPYADWLVENYSSYWTKSAWSNDEYTLAIVTEKQFWGGPGLLFFGGEWYICEDPFGMGVYVPGAEFGDCVELGPDGWMVVRGAYYGDYEKDGRAVRPVITMPIDVARKYYYPYYDVGTEITIANETFNVLSDEGNSVQLLAKYNIGTDYKQSTTPNYVTFADNKNWESYEDIDIQKYSTNPKTYTNNYVTYLKNVTGDNKITGSLFDSKNLYSSWCGVINYEYEDYDKICESSPYKAWIINGQDWWTKISYGTIEYFDSEGRLLVASDLTATTKGIRPVITISKDTLGRYIEET